MSVLELHHYGAIDRAVVRLDAETKRLGAAGDYNAMFPEGDAQALREVRDMLVEAARYRALRKQVTGRYSFNFPDMETPEHLDACCDELRTKEPVP